jgi:hypothetical protein
MRIHAARCICNSGVPCDKVISGLEFGLPGYDIIGPVVADVSRNVVPPPSRVYSNTGYPFLAYRPFGNLQSLQRPQTTF